jgi:aryl-alcohol dehydrogenase-like predicted oxidoreductase
MNRRKFIQGASAAAALMAIKPFAYGKYAGNGRKFISDKVVLGKTGITVSRLAMGTGTNGGGKASNQTRQLGLKGMSDLLQAAYDKGVFFWDSADQYGSHPHLKEALKHIPREKVVILTKTRASTEKEMREDLDRFRTELGTDYIDIMLLHCMMQKDWHQHKQGAMTVLSEARSKGIIKAHGVSCHTFDALKTAAASDWVQLDLARINPAGAVMDADVTAVEKVLKQMHAEGKSVMGMKILGAGELTGRIDECLQYTLAQDFIDCFTIGIENLDQLKDLEKRVPEASMRG